MTVYTGPNLKKYGIPDGSAIQIARNADAISETVRLLLEKSDQKLEEIARNQRFSLIKVSQDWNNTFVLSKLASDMVDVLEANQF